MSRDMKPRKECYRFPYSKVCDSDADKHATKEDEAEKKKLGQKRAGSYCKWINRKQVGWRMMRVLVIDEVFGDQ